MFLLCCNNVQSTDPVKFRNRTQEEIPAPRLQREEEASFCGEGFQICRYYLQVEQIDPADAELLKQIL